MKKNSIIIIAVLLIVLLTVFTVFQKVITRSKYNVDVSRTAIIKQLQTLNRYETTSFTIEKIIEAGTTQGNALSQFLYGDRILLIAHGEVIAGFDLATMKEQDLEIQGKTVTVTLPPAEILVTRLDSEQTRVYDRDQGLLSQGDKDLETQARVAAEQSITQAACEGGILVEASEKGRNQLTTILKAVGFETVIVQIPDSSC